MRRIPLLLLSTIALANGIQAASWRALPELPRGGAGTVTGDGAAVAFTNFMGGTSYHSPVSSVAPWTKSRADANTMSVVVRGNRIAYLVKNGGYNTVLYGALGDTVLKTASFGDMNSPLEGIDQDGHRILAVRGGSNSSLAFHLSTDTGELAKGASAGTVQAWRTLKMPSEFSNPGTARGWIEGRLVVASTATKSYLSRDTGATWLESPTPFLWNCDISGDTIVGKNYDSKRLFVSTDAGATWDSSALGAPLDVAFRGGKLYGYLWQDDTTYDLVSSANLGRSWNTVLEDIFPTEEFVAWDGTSLWTIRHDSLKRSSDEGRTWMAADSGLGETIVGKIRGFGAKLLVLQELDHPNGFAIPVNRLWVYDGRGWTLVREAVSDFEVMENDTGLAVFVLADSGSVQVDRNSGTKLRLERSYNLKAWQVMPGLAPFWGLLGKGKRGLLVGQKNNVAILTSSSRVLLDTAWKRLNAMSLKCGFLVEQDGEYAWNDLWQMSRSQDTTVVSIGNHVRGYATLGSKYGYRILDTAGGWMADFAPLATTYPLLKPTIASGAALMRDSIASWNGSDTIALMRPEGERRVLGPQGRGVTQVEWVSSNAVGSVIAMIDSTFAVADLHGRIWCFDKYGSVGVGASEPRSANLALVHGGVSLDLPRDAKVRVERFDAGGRSLGVLVDAVLAQGRHVLPMERVPGVSFAVATLDGIRQKAVVIAATGR